MSLILNSLNLQQGQDNLQSHPKTRIGQQPNQQGNPYRLKKLNGIFVLICEREIIAFNPKFQSCVRSYKKNAANPIIRFFSKNSNFIGLDENTIRSICSVMRLDQIRLSLLGCKRYSHQTYNLRYPMLNYPLTQRYFETMSQSLLTVWDFEAIKRISLGWRHILNTYPQYDQQVLGSKILFVQHHHDLPLVLQQHQLTKIYKKYGKI